jgi:hypothetical protein
LPNGKNILKYESVFLTMSGNTFNTVFLAKAENAFLNHWKVEANRIFVPSKNYGIVRLNFAQALSVTQNCVSDIVGTIDDLIVQTNYYTIPKDRRKFNFDLLLCNDKFNCAMRVTINHPLK